MHPEFPDFRPDLEMDYDLAVAMGPGKLLELLQRLYPERDLYSISLGFLQSRRYIAKARGTGGDVIVSWSSSMHKEAQHDPVRRQENRLG